MSRRDHAVSSTPKAVIFGCAGASLSPEERECFKTHQPLGFIFFSRNIDLSCFCCKLESICFVFAGWIALGGVFTRLIYRNTTIRF